MGVSFECISYVFRLYFPDLEEMSATRYVKEKRLTEMLPSNKPVARYFPSGLKHKALTSSLSVSKFLSTLHVTDQTRFQKRHPKNSRR
jgi:hypothetical protein